MMKKILSLTLAGLLSCNLIAAPAPSKANLNKFVSVMVTKYRFKEHYLNHLLATQRVNTAVLNKITYPYEAKPWSQYRKHFVTKQRILSGDVYWKKFNTTLTREKKVYGVPAAVVVAIIGVESNYGMHTHQYNELDALSTLAFHYPPRSAFFSKELKQFLLLTREQKINPSSMMGSYAGALGIPQFMPSSYRHYGVDFSHSGHVNLLTSNVDAIGSIGNYLKENGWNRWAPIATPVTVTGSAYKKVLSSNGKPNTSVRKLRTLGVQIPKAIHNWRMAALIQMGKKTPHYWVVYKNFRAIMSYNPRIPYAMAVTQLAQKLAKNRV
jgi:membrane-bound lytic murein transglycosylase B